MCPEDLIALVSAIAIAKETSLEDLAVFATVFTMLGDALEVYLAQCEFLTDLSKKTDG